MGRPQLCFLALSKPKTGMANTQGNDGKNDESDQPIRQFVSREPQEESEEAREKGEKIQTYNPSRLM